MNPQTNGILWKTIPVAVIVFVTRWLLEEVRGEEPKIFHDSRVYGVRKRIQIAGFGAAGIFAAVAIAFRREFTSPGELWLIMIPISSVLFGIWLATGSVITNDRGITKKAFFASRSIDWDRISGVRLYERQRYIEILAGEDKFSIDLRFVAHPDLLDQILRHSKVQLERK